VDIAFCLGEGDYEMKLNNLVNIEKKDKVNIIRLIFNEINRDQRDDIKKQMNALIDLGEKNFVVDLSRVGFLSSLVIATIIFFAKEVSLKGGQLKVFSTSSEPRAVLHLTKIDKIFEVYATEKEAVNSFK